MCGCLSGTLPQIPQQNVFLGLPLELMTEEAALLVEKGSAYIVDDVAAHTRGLARMQEDAKTQYLQQRQRECEEEALKHQKEVDEKKRKFKEGNGKETPRPHQDVEAEKPEDGAEDESLFSASSEKPATKLTTDSLLYYPTATVSDPTYHDSVPSSLVPSPDSSSYPLYKHLHSLGYFMSPGLRFGCQFMAYPGDPLRFHSHFTTRGLGWDEEVDMIDIVGGGRLGTGVKKAWMFGGKPEGAEDDQTRVFCVEWGGF
jgi:tRNA-splicing endonuclease subunit Sen34